VATEPDWSALLTMPLVDWQPEPKLEVPRTLVTRSRVPAIDIHNHLGRWLTRGLTMHDRWSYSATADWVVQDVDDLVSIMDTHNITTVVNLDGMWGQELIDNLERYDRHHPGRFVTFCQLDWHLLREPDGEDLLRASLVESAEEGARGLKVWKNLGLAIRDETDRVVLPDDPRVIRLLTLAGELGLPVLIHVADPMAFFDPLDLHNERLDELVKHRDWWFGDDSQYPRFEEIADALATLVVATPETDYIGAHVGCVAENLAWVEALLEKAPNFSVEIGGRIAEIGRQPRRFGQLLERFPDRVLFGTDVYPPTAEIYELHFRFLETEDESFDYRPDSTIPPQGRWQVSALGLSDAQLAAVYRGNAERVLKL
jgi:predicted TIM-barrel fold metal-dependent hydrolase